MLGSDKTDFYETVWKQTEDNLLTSAHRCRPKVWVCQLFISWFFNLLSDHSCPKGKPHSLFLPFISAVRKHRYLGQWEHKAQPILTNFNLSLSADGVSPGLSALISFSREYCHPVDCCFIHHLLPPVSLYCCTVSLVSVTRLYALEQEQWSFSLLEDLLQANCCLQLTWKKTVSTGK